MLLALQRLVHALGSESPSTHAFLLPALQYATDPDGPEALALLEDGLGTWLTALRCAPGPAPGLLALFPHLTAAMERSTGTRRSDREGFINGSNMIVMFVTASVLLEQAGTSTDECSLLPTVQQLAFAPRRDLHANHVISCRAHPSGVSDHDQLRAPGRRRVPSGARAGFRLDPGGADRQRK